MFWRSLPNDHVKFSYLRFWRQRWLEALKPPLVFHSFPLHETGHLCQASKSTLRLFCTMWWTWNNRKRLNLTQSSILMGRFRCSCRRSFLNSLIGSLRNYNNDDIKNDINLHIWPWKTLVPNALHVHFSFFDISQTFSFFPQREMTCFAVV